MTDVTAPTTGLPDPSLSVLLIGLGRRAREGVDVALQEHGLSYHHLSALGHLRRRPGLSYSELARRAGVTTQSMQTTMNRLEERGLVDRGGSTKQGRRADLRVTEHGGQVLVQAEAAVRVVDEELAVGLQAGERDLLERALMRMFGARPSRS